MSETQGNPRLERVKKLQNKYITICFKIYTITIDETLMTTRNCLNVPWQDSIYIFLNIGIWEIHQMSWYLGNSSNAWVTWKFPVIFEISKILIINHPQISVGIWDIPHSLIGIWGWYIFKILEISQMTGYLENFQKT